MTIVKVQVPIMTNDQRNFALVYGKGRANMKQQKLKPETIKALNGDPKAFFEADFDGTFWVIGKRVSYQPW